MKLNKKYWSDRYSKNEINWDLGQISPPLKSFIDKMIDKEINILIPGCGNGYEAEYLFNNGFLNTTVVDIAFEPLENFNNRVVGFPNNQLLNQNFFDLNEEKKFDLILEQTFFCAFHPMYRKNYVKKIYRLLNDFGKFAGLFFYNIPNTENPPFGGNKIEYLKLFSPYFDKITFQQCENSTSSRKDKEYWFEFLKNTTS